MSFNLSKKGKKTNRERLLARSGRQNHVVDLKLLSFHVIGFAVVDVDVLRWVSEGAAQTVLRLFRDGPTSTLRLQGWHGRRIRAKQVTRSRWDSYRQRHAFLDAFDIDDVSFRQLPHPLPPPHIHQVPEAWHRQCDGGTHLRWNATMRYTKRSHKRGTETYTEKLTGWGRSLRHPGQAVTLRMVDVR